MKLLIDTGASKSYIKSFEGLKNIKPLEHKFLVRSIHGADLIKEKTFVNVLNRTDSFYILPNLPLFDAIIGFSFLKNVNANIDTRKIKIPSIGHHKYFSAGHWHTEKR